MAAAELEPSIQSHKLESDEVNKLSGTSMTTATDATVTEMMVTCHAARADASVDQWGRNTTN